MLSGILVGFIILSNNPELFVNTVQDDHSISPLDLPEVEDAGLGVIQPHSLNPNGPDSTHFYNQSGPDNLWDYPDPHSYSDTYWGTGTIDAKTVPSKTETQSWNSGNEYFQNAEAYDFSGDSLDFDPGSTGVGSFGLNPALRTNTFEIGTSNTHAESTPILSTGSGTNSTRIYLSDNGVSSMWSNLRATNYQYHSNWERHSTDYANRIYDGRTWVNNYYMLNVNWQNEFNQAS